MMKSCRLLMAMLVFGLAACITPTSRPLPKFEVDRAKLKVTPPEPTATVPGAKGSAIVPDKIKIDPKTARGYKDLSTSITQIYNVTPLKLSMEDVVTETLANNRQLKIQGYTLRIAEYEVPVSKGIYDLLLGSRAEFDRTEQQTSNVGFGSLGVNRSRTRLGEVSFSQLLPTGAQLNFAYDAIRSSVLTPLITPPTFAVSGLNVTNYQQSATLGITQPLLQGFGPSITNAGIHIAQLERQGAAADFQAQVQNQLTNALIQYYELIGAIEFFKVQVISYAAARDLMRINEAKFRAGVVARTDVVQAEASAEGRRDQVIRARQAIRNNEDQLKRILFLQEGRPLWNAEIAPTQIIGWREISVDLEKTVEVALQNRPELRRAVSNINQTEVTLHVAKNNLLPQLNLFGQVQPNGLNTNFDRSFDTLSDAKFTSYKAGVQFSYPLQNRTARYRYKQASARNEQAGESLRDLQDQITEDVRFAVRDLVTARERIDVSQSQVRAEEVKLDAENKRYAVGISTAYQVLLFQGDLATAQNDHIRAVIDYNIATIRLERARGTMFPTFGISVAGADLNPKPQPVIFPVGLN